MHLIHSCVYLFIILQRHSSMDINSRMDSRCLNNSKLFAYLNVYIENEHSVCTYSYDLCIILIMPMPYFYAAKNV